MYIDPIIIKAADYARSAHYNQKYNNLPYFIHVEAVATMVSLIDPLNINAIAAAYLHDVVEDTIASIEDLQCHFNNSIIEIVDLCTDPEAPSRKQKKVLFYDRFAKTKNVSARLVKVCDRINNVLNNKITGNYKHLKMYRNEHPAFREAVFSYDSMLLDSQKTLDSLIGYI